MIDSEARDELLNLARVPKEFRRNSGEIRSIWGKWLGSKLTGKVYDEITDRLKGYANKMPDADEVIKQLEQTKTKLLYEKLTPESWQKAFPNNTASTPLGEFNMKEDQYQKLKDRKREYLFGAIKTTLREPDYIIVDKNNGTLIIKSFSDHKGSTKNAVIVIEYYKGRELIVSMHEKRNATIKNKVKDGNLLIYSRFQRSSQHSSESQQFTRTGVSFNFADKNINKNELKINSYGELWGELIPGKVYKSVLRKIIYKITGIEIEITKDGRTKVITDNYSNIDKYRIGVLIERV